MSYTPTRMFVTVDSVALSYAAGSLNVLLIRRANEPYRGCWALPGGFVEEDEDLPDACARELLEETGLRPVVLAQIGAWGKPGRDPRGRNVTVAYLALVRPGQEVAAAGGDAAGVQWHRVEQLPPLAFDHADIVAAGLVRLRELAVRTRAAFALLPEKFASGQLRDVMSVVCGRCVSGTEAAALARRAGMAKAARGIYLNASGDFLAPLKDA